MELLEDGGAAAGSMWMASRRPFKLGRSAGSSSASRPWVSQGRTGRLGRWGAGSGSEGSLEMIIY